MEVINIKDCNSGLEVKHRANLFFYGSKESPFLAPRGVFVHHHLLLVSDTAQNRIFIWKNLPQGNYQEPDIVIGQNNTTDTQRNAGTLIDASSLLYPSGIWTDGVKLIVADAWNHRVLVWHSFPTTHHQKADVVIGQKTMAENLPNQKGVGAHASADSLYWCYGVFSDGKQLWIADTGNRRVLYYKDIPTSNGQMADKVIGQENFNERDYHNANAIWPYSVKVSPHGELAISDTQYYRVLLWKHYQDAFTQQADVIIGQENFSDNGQNQSRLRPSQRSLNWCYDSCFHERELLVADTGNSRVLRYKQMPQQNNIMADDLYGNIHFEAIGEHLETGILNNQRLYWPFSICTQDSLLYVADTGNHRIAVYPL